MAFAFITGPMKSGKSLELIARVEPFRFAKKKVLYLQPKLNTRESDITSRSGVNIGARVVSSLQEVDDSFDVVGIDEIHMFNVEDASIIDQWIRAGKDVFVSGLDLDYRGTMLEVIHKLLELSPDSMIVKRAVCESCHAYDARFTQVLDNGEPVLAGLPQIIPDDGAYTYEARCRKCFVRGT